MIEQKLGALVEQALAGAAGELGFAGEAPVVELDRPRQKEFGDFTTNVALALASQVGRAPREVAEAIVRHLPAADFLRSAEVAGPGFINFRVTHGWLYDVLRELAARGESFGHIEPTGERVQVEYVSANPVGPLHIGTGRNAVLGDALANLLEFAGRDISREYYFNDAGRQIDLFGESVEARYLEKLGRPAEFPEEGYRGEYIKILAGEIGAEGGDSLADLPPDVRRSRIQALAIERMFAWIKGTLDRLGVHMNAFVSERTFHETGAIAETVERLREAGHAFEQDGAIFFRATEFGDEKDRVLIRSNGEPTYFAADCAYVVDKFSRGFDHLIYVWGADHHGTVRRLKGAARALGYDPALVEVILYQLVSLYRGHEPVKMSKRSGDLITLDELLDEVGADAVRFTLLYASSDHTINFDIEEAKRQSLDNPVFYVQYAHARIASILRHAQERGIRLKPIEEVDLELLSTEAEVDLLREIAELPEQVLVAADLRAPHRLTHFARSLGERFHRFYTECRVVTEDDALTQARLWLAAGTKRAIANVMGILGVSVPESMERIDE